MNGRIEFDKKNGLWWPTNCNVDADFAYMLRRVTDIDLAVKHCHKTALAVQAGGNIGLWPLRLAKSFSIVHTFEPVPVIYNALCMNTNFTPGVMAHNALLSDKIDRVIPFSIRSGAVSRVVEDHTTANSLLKATTIDSLNLPCCDALFLDVEGHEIEALKGATQTIQKFRPVITVEVWEANMDAYMTLFDLFEYDRVAKVHGDFIFAPRK